MSSKRLVMLACIGFDGVSGILFEIIWVLAGVQGTLGAVGGVPPK